MTPLALLKKRYLSHTRCVRYLPGLQGQQVDDQGTIFVGNRAGHTRSVSFLVHELSHFVEIDDRRMQLYMWGLHVPTVVICGTTCYEPTTRAMTERELRVMAFQMNLLESLGVPTRAHYLVEALRFMADFLHVPLEDGRSAYGDDGPKDGEMSYREREDSRVRWMAKHVEELRAVHTLERFDQEWTRKIALLEVNSLESPAI